jgi:ATP-dependent exoDNAse (exonuclease V) beta subunit
MEPQINQAIHDLHAWHQSDKSKKLFVLSKLSQQYFSLVLTHHLESIAKQIKKDRNFLLISDFHNLVSEVVQQSQAPYIYEKVGERYSDILFDEFQDTSGLQWSNFLPLVHNSLAADGTVFIVGDGKQSIYRWRNGKVEQFIELPHVPETEATANINVLTNSLLERVTLNDNWRSAKKIVEFNNAFFDQLKGHYPEINEVYEEQEQHAKGNTEGYISWQACMGEEGEKEVLDGIVEAIKESVQDGFSYADITLITRKGGKESGPIAAHLKQHGIKVSTKDSFLLSLSPRVNLIMSYLFVLAMPKDEFYRFDFVRNLQQVFPELFSEEGWDQWIMEYTRLKDQQVGHCFLNLAEYKQKVASLFPRLPLTWSTGSSAFDVARRAIEIWELPCDEYVEYLLDQLTSKNQQWGYSPSELIQWWLKAKQKLCIQQGENQDAVTIQTIHKTKGLEFPVVIYPRFQSKSPSQPLWVNVEKEGLGIQDALLNYTVGEPRVFHPDEFVHEYKMSVLDEVNLMYVAMTRPVDRLYILHEEKKENTKESSPKSSLYSISGRMMKEVLEKLGGESEGEKVKYGVRSGPSARKNDQKIEVEHRQETGLKQTAIRLRLRELKRRKLNRFIPSQLKGEAIHQAMEEWLTGKHEAEIWGAIEQEYGKLEGGLNWKNWQEEWRKTIALDQWQAFLDHKEKLFIEQPILDERGNEWRPDIFWIGEESIQLVDIKTGVAEEKHVDQIQNYARILEKVWNKPVSMNLVYTLTCQWQKLN